MRPSRRALAMLALLVLPLFAACFGDDDGESSQAELALYFRDLETAKAQYERRLDGVPPLIDQSIAATVENLREQNEVITNLVADLEALDVPPELVSEHGVAVSALEKRIEVQRSIVAICGGQDTCDFDKYRPQREGALKDGANALCALQVHAERYGISIELDCDVEDLLALARHDRPFVDLPRGEAACALTLAERAEERSTFIDFVNRRDEPVRIHRVSRAGERELFATLDPDGTHFQVTYINEGWIVTDEDGECLGGYSAQGNAINLTIQPDTFSR